MASVLPTLSLQSSIVSETVSRSTCSTFVNGDYPLSVLSARMPLPAILSAVLRQPIRTFSILR